MNTIQAFPSDGGPSSLLFNKGMTLRDYFAARALQGICASGPSADLTNYYIAKESYALADAMIKARNNES